MWITQFLNRYKKYKFGQVVSLGNPQLFSSAINGHGLQIVFDKSLGHKGKYYPPDALAFGGASIIGIRSTGLRNPHLYLNDPEGLGPNVTTWHELIHAIIYNNNWRDLPCMGSGESEKSDREEAYTWLVEERINWLGKLISYDADYKLAKAETDPVKRNNLISRLERKWNLIQSSWIRDNLKQGPSKYGQHSITPGGVKTLDSKLGINIDIARIKAVYPPLNRASVPVATKPKSATGAGSSALVSNVSLLNSKWTVSIDYAGSWGVRSYSVVVINDSPNSFKARVTGKMPGDSPQVFSGKRNGRTVNVSGVRPVRSGEPLPKPLVIPLQVNLSADYKSLNGWMGSSDHKKVSGIRVP